MLENHWASHIASHRPGHSVWWWWWSGPRTKTPTIVCYFFHALKTHHSVTLDNKFIVPTFSFYWKRVLKSLIFNKYKTLITIVYTLHSTTIVCSNPAPHFHTNESVVVPMFLPFMKHNSQTGTRRFTLQFNQCRCCPDHFRPPLKVVGWVWNDFIDRVHRGPSFCRPKFVRSPWYQQLNFVAATAGSNSATVVAPKESDSTHGQNMVDVRKINHQGNRVHL
jgi:hypothetical protein